MGLSIEEQAVMNTMYLFPDPKDRNELIEVRVSKILPDGTCIMDNHNISNSDIEVLLKFPEDRKISVDPLANMDIGIIKGQFSELLDSQSIISEEQLLDQAVNSQKNAAASEVVEHTGAHTGVPTAAPAPKPELQISEGIKLMFDVITKANRRANDTISVEVSIKFDVDKTRALIEMLDGDVEDVEEALNVWIMMNVDSNGIIESITKTLKGEMLGDNPIFVFKTKAHETLSKKHGDRYEHDVAEMFINNIIKRVDGEEALDSQGMMMLVDDDPFVIKEEKTKVDESVEDETKEE